MSPDQREAVRADAKSVRADAKSMLAGHERTGWAPCQCCACGVARAVLRYVPGGTETLILPRDMNVEPTGWAPTIWLGVGGNYGRNLYPEQARWVGLALLAAADTAEVDRG